MPMSRSERSKSAVRRCARRLPVGSARPLLSGAVVLCAVAGTLAAASGASAAASSRSPRPVVWSTAQRGWTRVQTGPVVSGGRVWVLDQSGTSTEFRVRSRELSLQARTERSWRATLPESLRGAPGFTGGGSVYRSDAINDDLGVLFAGFAIDGATAYVGAAWCLEASGILDLTRPTRCAGSQVAAFPLSGGAGTIVSQPGERLAFGPASPATAFRVLTPAEGDGARLRTLGTGETFAFPGLPDPETDVDTSQVDGSRILEYRYRPDDAAHRHPPLGWSMFDYRTGAAQYRVNYATVAHAMARRRREADHLDVALRPDGELGTFLTLANGKRRYGIRPALVDATGAHRFVGSRLRGAYGARVLPAGPSGRNFVSVTGSTQRKGARRFCDGTWITDRAGERAVRVRSPSALAFVQDAFVHWDGQTLLADGLTSRRTGDREGSIVSWRGLGRVPLRKGAVPTCPRGR